MVLLSKSMFSKAPQLWPASVLSLKPMRVVGGEDEDEDEDEEDEDEDEEEAAARASSLSFSSCGSSRIQRGKW